MDQVSRPLLGVLLATVAVAALWFTMLKPKPSAGGGSGGTNAYQSDVAKAHQAVAIANHASAAQGGSTATPTTPTTASILTPTHTLASTPAIAPAIPATKHPAAKHANPATKPVAKPAVTTAQAHGATRHRLDEVTAALRARKVLALLFYNPAGTADVAVKNELSVVPTHGGRVVKLSVPVKELARYPVITTQVPVTQSPTLVLIDRRRQATTLVGFAGSFEIGQRVAAALAVKQPRK